MVANGYVPSQLLRTVSGQKLYWKTAEAFEQMSAAYNRYSAGALNIVPPAGGYRSFFIQGDMKKRPWLYNLNPASSVNLAAPGYSTHGLGTAVDIADFTGDRKRWVLANMARFGFHRPFGERDPNHLQHNATVTAGTPPRPIENEDDLNNDDKQWIMRQHDTLRDELLAAVGLAVVKQKIKSRISGNDITLGQVWTHTQLTSSNALGLLENDAIQEAVEAAIKSTGSTMSVQAVADAVVDNIAARLKESE